MKKVIIVGFKVKEDRSIFYRKFEPISDYDVEEWMKKMAELITKTKPDFVSMRFIYE